MRHIDVVWSLTLRADAKLTGDSPHLSYVIRYTSTFRYGCNFTAS